MANLKVRKAKQRQHNEWFNLLSKTSCTGCGAKKIEVWGWYEYVSAKRRLIQHFCEKCIHVVKYNLKAHADDCGCLFTFQISGYQGKENSKVVGLLREIEEELNKCEYT